MVMLDFRKAFDTVPHQRLLCKLKKYSIDGNQHHYLGVILDKTMSFTAHIKDTVSKASKVLNFVKRNLSSFLQSTKVAAYLSLVRPTLEYSSSVWDPYQLVYINNIEKIQRRAARWVY